MMIRFDYDEEFLSLIEKLVEKATLLNKNIINDKNNLFVGMILIFIDMVMKKLDGIGFKDLVNVFLEAERFALTQSLHVYCKENSIDDAAIDSLIQTFLAAAGANACDIANTIESFKKNPGTSKSDIH